ncbi:MAG: DUF411 domain-containing protein [Rhodospirillales bacterium]|jgi:hypothetical protein|nr:DUF411 domain-containing protein [Rhodospirillales bacterium]
MKTISRRGMIAGGIGLVAAAGVAGLWWTPDDARGARVIVFKSPLCGCCGGYVEHLRANGFRVNVKSMDDVTPVKERLGVPDDLWSCHTSLVGGYVVEGHVPLVAVRRLLAEKPAVKGIALPGMPDGSPGMPGPKSEPFVIQAFGAGAPKVFMRL